MDNYYYLESDSSSSSSSNSESYNSSSGRERDCKSISNSTSDDINSDEDDSGKNSSEDDSDDGNEIYNKLVQEAHAIQIRGGRRKNATFLVETPHFHSYFGTSKKVVMHLWHLLANHNLLPGKAKKKHLLWALYFMKVYPTDPSTCLVLGGSCGAIDPKTM
jgi:hypothetical protein